MPPLVTNGSSRAAALPAAPVAPISSPFSFFSRHVVMNVARSIVRTRVRIPMRLEIAADRLAQRRVGRQRREVAGVEAVGVARLGQELLGALGIVAAAARPCSAKSNSGGTKEPVGLPSPSISAWLIALRSMARLAAWRTRRSCHGDFGSHWSRKSSQ